MSGLLFGYPSISEMLRSDRMGIAFKVDEAWIRGGSCVPEQEWLERVADWLYDRREGDLEELSIQCKGCCSFDQERYDQLLAQLPPHITRLFTHQPLDRVFCSNELSSTKLIGLPCHYPNRQHVSGLLAVMIKSPVKVGAFFFQPPVIQSAFPSRSHADAPSASGSVDSL